MVDVVTEVVIDRPPDELAAYVSDPSNAPEWYVNIESATWESDPPLRVGSQVASLARFLGRRLAYTYQITEYEPGRRLVMRTAQGPFPMETTYTWEPAEPSGTRMTLRNRGRPSGFSKPAVPLMTAALSRANRKDLDRLRTMLESKS